jgi:hypothetical protein
MKSWSAVTGIVPLAAADAISVPLTYSLIVPPSYVAAT